MTLNSITTMTKWFTTRVVPLALLILMAFSMPIISLAELWVVLSAESTRQLLLTKRFTSSTCGHSHLADFSVRTNGKGRKIMGAVCGVYQDYECDWAGVTQDLWWKGVLFKRNVENGVYDPEFISLNTIKKAYKNHVW